MMPQPNPRAVRHLALALSQQLIQNGCKVTAFHSEARTGLLAACLPATPLVGAGGADARRSVLLGTATEPPVTARIDRAPPLR